MVKITFQYLKFIAVVCLLSGVLTNCGSKKRVASINTIQPAAITIPQDVKSIVIVDRTESNHKAVNVIEGILTGEVPGEDKAAVQNFITGLRSQLSASQRFTVKTGAERLKGNSLTRAFPEQLSWNKIEGLCRQYQTDAVVAVEIFDSDFVVTDGVRKIKKTVKTNDDEKEIEVDEYYANGIDDIKIGIRVYNLKNRTIEDQELFTKSGQWESAGESKVLALASLISKSAATQDLSRQIGADYAYRIAPMPITLSRNFVGKSKKSDAVFQGTKHADVGNWKQAIQVWKQGIGSAEPKEAGLLTHNIAIGYEVLGDLTNAEQWASQSYTKYNNKKAKAYLEDIRRRMADENLSKYQLSNN